MEFVLWKLKYQHNYKINLHWNYVWRKKMVLTVISILEKQVIIFKTPELTIIESLPSNNENLHKLLQRKYDISMLPLETVTSKGLNT